MLRPMRMRSILSNFQRPAWHHATRAASFFRNMRQSPPRRTEKAQPNAADLLRSGVWSAEQVALLMDTPVGMVEGWCKLRMLPGSAWNDGRWHIPGPALFFFCGGSFERHYSPETAAALLDVEVSTVRSWIKHGRMPVEKLGVAKSAPVRIKDSILRRFVTHE